MQRINDIETPDRATDEQREILSIKFPAGNTLIVDKLSGELKLVSKQRITQLVIRIKDEGLEVDIDATQLNIHATEELTLSSKRVNVAASEHLNIETPGNLVMDVGKDCLTQVAGTNKNVAQTQRIVADLGNVELKANDDIRLDGERVLLNCD